MSHVLYQGKQFDGCFGSHDPNRDRKWITWVVCGGSDRATHPIYEEDWYFVDETGNSIFGPYDTKEEADQGLSEYAKTI